MIILYLITSRCSVIIFLFFCVWIFSFIVITFFRKNTLSAFRSDDNMTIQIFSLRPRLCTFNSLYCRWKNSSYVRIHGFQCIISACFHSFICHFGTQNSKCFASFFSVITNINGNSVITVFQLIRN